MKRKEVKNMSNFKCTPQYNPVYVESFDEAREIVWKQAREQAEYLGIDESDLDEYGDEEIGFGVCPPNDSGAYWPQCREVDENE